MAWLMLDIVPFRLQDYMGVVRRRFWIVLVLALAAALAAYIYTSRQQPVYQAGVSVSVTPNVIDYWTIQAVERLLNTYVDRVRTWEVAQRVVEQQQLDVPPGNVLSGLRIIVVPASYKVIIQSESNSSHQAVAVVNGFADELVALAQSEQSSGPGGDVFLHARVLDRASSAGQIGPRVRYNVAVALVLGVIAGVILALAAEFLDARVRLREETEHILDVPVISCIPPVPKSNTVTSS
jgi:capsular polysaccharide biosynthesis protein